MPTKTKPVKQMFVPGLDRIAAQIEKTNHRLALGYESTLDFNYGYIMGLFQHGIISIKEKNALIKVYASTENDNCEFSIKDGKLIKHED